VLSTDQKNVKKVAAVEATREHGNQLFKAGDLDQAYAVYERGVLIVNGALQVRFLVPRIAMHSIQV
jgi:hypothetical protein